MEASAGRDTDGVELIAYSAVDNAAASGDFVATDRVLSLHDDGDVVEVVKALGEGDENPAAGGDGY